VASGALAFSCSSASSTPAPTGTWSAIYPAIFPETTKAQCDFCHSLPPNEKSNGGLSVGTDKETAYKALVGQSSASLKCNGRQYVVPGKPDESLLYGKVTTPPCGDHMPLGGSTLTDDQVEMIRTWIEAGAKDD
jgi:hypothetical protein